MNDTLTNATRNLRELLKSLPVVRERNDGEALRRHLALIAHYRRRHDRLATASGS